MEIHGVSWRPMGSKNLQDFQFGRAAELQYDAPNLMNQSTLLRRASSGWRDDLIFVRGGMFLQGYRLSFSHAAAFS